MKKEIVFSIIVPAYQIEEYIQECIESIEKQDFNLYEIIIVDDGSQDSTPTVCDRLKSEYDNITVIHQKNQGVSEARNNGFKIARGRYCVLVDGDDIIVDGALRNLYNCVVKNNYPDVVANRVAILDNVSGKLKECEYVFEEKRLNKENVAKKYEIIQSLKDCHLGRPWMFCVKREYILEKELFFYQGILHEDEEWVPKIFFNTTKIAFNNNILYGYRICRENSTMSTLNIKRVFDKLLIIDLLQKRFIMPTYSKEIVDIMKLREQMILFGVLNDVANYRDNSRYKEALVEIKKKIYILKNSRRCIHRVCYYMSCILGVKLTGIIFNKLVILKG